ncbi:GNAT family N-acetyltransferase [Isosphaeraceae bacterium EP7]
MTQSSPAMPPLPSGSNGIGPCPEGDRPAALAVLYRRVHEALRPGLIADALDEASQGRVDLSGLWVARRRGKIVGALLTHSLAGRAVAFWPPEVEGFWGRASMAEGLVRAALEQASGDGAGLAQALLDESSPKHAAADLARAGMPRVADLISMTRGTDGKPIDRGDAPSMEWRPFSDDTRDAFRAALTASYRGSLDMPELEGIRSLDDVLASHSAGGRFDPGRWQLGTIPGEPSASAVVLLADQPDRSAWEVAYLGLTPAARGRGLGLTALARALELAAPYVIRVELAVDSRNTPALRLYERAGFREFDRRSVHLAVFRPAAG